MSYETIELEMKPELQDKLVEAYVLRNFSGASIDAFYNNFEADSKIEDQLFAAVLNEMINQAIREEMGRLKESKELPELSKIFDEEELLEGDSPSTTIEE
jgi:hypothetical protein